MDFPLNDHLLLLFLFPAILLLSFQVKSLDGKKNLLDSLNGYRESMNLTTLAEIDNADCLADEVADQLKNQPCSNTTGVNTARGTVTELPNYPDLLAKCHLSINTTRDGVVMPVCIPNQVLSLVVKNYTKSQYSQYVNNSTYTGAGVGHEGDWVVVVLSTNTSGGSFKSTESAARTMVSIVGLTQNLMPMLLGLFLLLLC